MARSASFGTSAPVLAVINGIPITTSLDVARYFGKRHDRVLRAIRDLIAQLPAERLPNFGETFIEVTGPNGATRSEPAYRLTRDGFTLLAMGFTGARALEFKLAYLDAFNRMEAELAQRPQALPAPTLPDIDVAALLLSGQSNPVPLTPEQYRLVDQRAYALSADAHALIREHLLRAVAHHTTWLTREEAGNTTVTALLDSITLGQALAHQHFNQVRAAAGILAGTRDLVTQAHARVLAYLDAAGQPARAR
jgi:Rha family phage regulatory protein